MDQEENAQRYGNPIPLPESKGLHLPPAKTPFPFWQVALIPPAAGPVLRWRRHPHREALRGGDVPSVPQALP